MLVWLIITTVFFTSLISSFVFIYFLFFSWDYLSLVVLDYISNVKTKSFKKWKPYVYIHIPIYVFGFCFCETLPSFLFFLLSVLLF